MVATTAMPVAIASAAGSEKPSYSDGHDSELGFGVELDDALVGHAADERDGVGEAEAFDRLGAAATGLGTADHREREVVALGAQLGERFEQIREALQRDIGARRS